MFTAWMIQYSCREKNIPLHIIFIDIAKAYDSVDRTTLWKILHLIGIPPKLLAYLQALYSDGNCRVKLGSKLSKAFKILMGLKQGCPAACILFNISFAIIIQIIKHMLETKGITLTLRVVCKNKNSKDISTWIIVSWWCCSLCNIRIWYEWNYSGFLPCFQLVWSHNGIKKNGSYFSKNSIQPKCTGPKGHSRWIWP